MSNKEHIWIPRLKQQLADRLIGRREFIRYSALLGMSAGAAYMWAGRITGQPLAPPARAAELPKGGVVKVAMRIPKLDNPHTFSWIYNSNVVRQVNGYLTRTGVDNVTRPALASKWEASEDLKTWTFTIADINWHDGRPFTAEDAAWNIKHCLDEATGSSVLGLMKGYMLKEVDKGKKDDKGNPTMSTELWDANAIEVKDPKTLILHLQEPQVAVPEHFFHYPFPMLDPKENGVWGVKSNGTGAFTPVEIEVGRKAVVKAVDGHGAHLDAIEFIDLGDNPSAQAAALASKQVHGLYETNIEQLELYQSMDHVNRYDAITADTCVARMQPIKPFDDPRVRKAMRLATDQAKTLELAHRGIGTIAEHHHVSPVHPDYKKLPMMTQNIEEAKKLLEEAGYKDGIDIEIFGKSDPTWEGAAIEAMVEQWKPAGIRAKINILPSAKYWDIWTTVPFGFTIWAHRPLGFMVLALAYRTGVPWNEFEIFQQGVRRAARQGRGNARCGRPRRDHRPAREDLAGGRADRAAALALAVHLLRQARAGLPDASDPLHLRRGAGHPGLIQSPISACRRLADEPAAGGCEAIATMVLLRHTAAKANGEKPGKTGHLSDRHTAVTVSQTGRKPVSVAQGDLRMKLSRNISRRGVVKGSAAAGAVALFAPAYVRNALSSSGEINVMFWSDELPEDLLKSFTEKTGIKVNFTGFGSNEELLNKMKSTKGEGFDVISPTLNRVPQWKELGVTQAWDLKKVPVDRLNPAMLKAGEIWNLDGKGQHWLPHVLGNRGHLLAHRQMAAQGRIPELWRHLGRCQCRQDHGPQPFADPRCRPVDGGRGQARARLDAQGLL